MRGYGARKIVQATGNRAYSRIILTFFICRDILYKELARRANQ